MKKALSQLILAISLTAPVLHTQAQGAPQTTLPRTSITAGMYLIDAQVAMAPREREIGLMYRKEMPAQEGMLFVFTQEERHCMWMRNTFLPLSVAFLDANGLILDIEDMEPQTEDNHCAAAPARFALEMNKGWFAGKGIKPGQRIGGVEKSPRPQ